MCLLSFIFYMFTFFNLSCVCFTSSRRKHKIMTVQRRWLHRMVRRVAPSPECEQKEIHDSWFQETGAHSQGAPDTRWNGVSRCTMKRSIRRRTSELYLRTPWKGVLTQRPLLRKRQQQLYLLRKLISFNVDSAILKVFYNSFIESVLTFCFVCWFCNDNKVCKKCKQCLSNK